MDKLSRSRSMSGSPRCGSGRGCSSQQNACCPEGRESDRGLEYSGRGTVSANASQVLKIYGTVNQITSADYSSSMRMHGVRWGRSELKKRSTPVWDHATGPINS
jgi:hypothetical protein